jgi:hypothetical protein
LEYYRGDPPVKTRKYNFVQVVFGFEFYQELQVLSRWKYRYTHRKLREGTLYQTHYYRGNFHSTKLDRKKILCRHIVDIVGKAKVSKEVVHNSKGNNRIRYSPTPFPRRITPPRPFLNYTNFHEDNKWYIKARVWNKVHENTDDTSILAEFVPRFTFFGINRESAIRAIGHPGYLPEDHNRPELIKDESERLNQYYRSLRTEWARIPWYEHVKSPPKPPTLFMRISVQSSFLPEHSATFQLY